MAAGGQKWRAVLNGDIYARASYAWQGGETSIICTACLVVVYSCSEHDIASATTHSRPTGVIIRHKAPSICTAWIGGFFSINISLTSPTLPAKAEDHIAFKVLQMCSGLIALALSTIAL